VEKHKKEKKSRSLAGGQWQSLFHHKVVARNSTVQENTVQAINKLEMRGKA